MSARVRSMALDSGTSTEAADMIAGTDRARVRAVVTAILAEAGSATDDEIVAKYEERARKHGTVPWVTPQRIRTARAELVRAGAVRDAQLIAYSTLGNKATAWTLT